MAADTSKLRTKLTNLNSSLLDLESLLAPLLSQSLSEILIGLEPIQQAKLQTVLPYLVYDLVFIYLKAKGVDPKAHSVVSELDRVRQYFEKITDVENKPTRRVEVDKNAADRFIKHAISQAKSQMTASTPTDLSTHTTIVPVKVTTKMIARAQYEHTLGKEHQEDESDEELQVYDEASPGSPRNDTQGTEEATFPIADETQPSSSLKRLLPLSNPSIHDGEDGRLLRSNKRTKNNLTDVSSVATSTLGRLKQKKKKKAKKI